MMTREELIDLIQKMPVDEDADLWKKMADLLALYRSMSPAATGEEARARRACCGAGGTGARPGEDSRGGAGTSCITRAGA